MTALERFNTFHDLWPWISFLDQEMWREPWRETIEGSIDSAVRSAVLVVADELGDQLPDLDPEERTIQAARLVQEAARTILGDVVAEARARGASWTTIGQVLGVGRTAAHKRFAEQPSSERRDQLEAEARVVMQVASRTPPPPQAARPSRQHRLWLAARRFRYLRERERLPVLVP